MMKRRFGPLVLMLSVTVILVGSESWAELDPEQEPRLAKLEVSRCVETAKTFLRSQEYDDREEELSLIAACREVDGNCVQIVGEYLASSESASANKFLPVIRACRGRGMGECYKMATSRMPSFDYRDSDQALRILKKCE